MDAFEPCDACGHRSYIAAVWADGRRLTYCVHHGLEYTPGLEAQGASVDDQSWRLYVEEAAR